MKKIFAIIVLLATPAFAASVPANIPPLKEKTVGVPNAALAAKVESYLNSIKTLEAEFGQATSDNSLSSGKFYLQRPGKFRWEYLQGQEVLIIGNSTQIVYYDRKLDEVTYIPTQYSIATFLADDNIKLSGDIKIVSLTEDAKQIRLIVAQTKKPDEGSLALYFDKEPMKLTHLEAFDQDKNLTAVVFKNQKFNQPLAKDKFIFKDPKFYKDVWKKK